jgi:hypothetical protein
MAHVAAEFFEDLSTFGRIPFGHGELPALWVMHLKRFTSFFGGKNSQRRDRDQTDDRDEVYV